MLYLCMLVRSYLFLRRLILNSNIVKAKIRWFRGNTFWSDLCLAESLAASLTLGGGHRFCRWGVRIVFVLHLVCSGRFLPWIRDTLERRRGRAPLLWLHVAFLPPARFALIFPHPSIKMVFAMMRVSVCLSVCASVFRRHICPMIRPYISIKKCHLLVLWPPLAALLVFSCFFFS
jgi:hypothetical protein